MALIIEKLGRLGYEEARERQHEAVIQRADGTLPDDVLYLLEHEPVFTLGRGTDSESLPLNPSIPVVESERGGDITWHGPGQLTGYWIRKLDGSDRDLHQHLRLIEERLIQALQAFDITANRSEGLTGVWIDGQKIASIGVAVRRWVAYHGFSLNVNVDASIYETFHPCGLEGGVMTDLSTVIARAVTLDEAINAVADAFSTNP